MSSRDGSRRFQWVSVSFQNWLSLHPRLTTARASAECPFELLQFVIWYSSSLDGAHGQRQQADKGAEMNEIATKRTEELGGTEAAVWQKEVRHTGASGCAECGAPSLPRLHAHAEARCVLEPAAGM